MTAELSQTDLTVFEQAVASSPEISAAERAVRLYRRLHRPADAPRPAAARTLDDVHRLILEEMRLKHDSYQTLRCYQGWIRRFARFLQGRGPVEIADHDARRFLSHLAVQSKVGAKTQHQALHALVFLFKRLLGRPIILRCCNAA